jgi:hypothetical protein
MNWLFLEGAALDTSEVLTELGITGAEGFGEVIALVLSLVFAFMFFAFIVSVGVYVYSSLAYMTIGKKGKDEKPWLAWIPVVGKPLLTMRMSGMPWWPMLFLLGIFLFPIPFVGVFLGYGAILAFTVFTYIWRWKAYEKVGHPGWFSLLFLVSVVGLVFLGIVAWSKENVIEPVKKSTRAKPKARPKKK